MAEDVFTLGDVVRRGFEVRNSSGVLEAATAVVAVIEAVGAVARVDATKMSGSP